MTNLHTVNLSPSVYSDLNRLNNWRFHVKHLKLGHQQKMMAQTGGTTHTLRKGRGMDFSEVRAYQPGDEVRHIDWRVTARSQKTHTKLFTEEHERPTILLVEQSPSLFFGSQHCFKSVLALDIMAILGWATLNQNDKIGGLVWGSQAPKWIEPKRHHQALQHLFEQGLKQNKSLNQPAASDHQAWSGFLRQISSQIHPASRIFIIGDLFNLDPSALNRLQALSRHAVISALHVYDPLEKTLPDIGKVELTDGVKSQKIDTSSSAWQALYQTHYQQAWLHLKQQLQPHRIPLVALATNENAIDTLLQHRVLRP